MKRSTIVFLAIWVTISACSQNTRKIKTEPRLSDKALSKYRQATFGAGCFWHEEAMFESIKGVKEAVSGYAGGKTSNPTYKSIETGTTGHAETVNVFYDSTLIDFPTLVKIYFAGQDPTQVNGQGPDRGPQYRSIAFYRNDNERKIIEDHKKSIGSKHKEPIAVQILPFNKFWTAEAYHQNYIEKNPSQSYVRMVSIPEIKRLQSQYPQMVKRGYKY